MGMESKLRNWAHGAGLQKSDTFVRFYGLVCSVRFAGRWNKPVPFRGAKFLIGHDQSLFPAVHSGGFEALELDEFLTRVNRSSHVWDVGANVGIYSVLLGRAACEGTVVAFEPVPTTRERLQYNLKINATSNVRVVDMALSDQEGSAWMAVHNSAHGCDHILDEEDDHQAEANIEIHTTTADDFIKHAGVPDPDVIKIDIEGFEPEFLSGARELMSRKKPLMLVEVNPSSWNNPQRIALWEAAIRDLFKTYEKGLWFSPQGVSEISELDVTILEPRAYTLMLGYK